MSFTIILYRSLCQHKYKVIKVTIHMNVFMPSRQLFTQLYSNSIVHDIELSRTT